MVIEQAQNVSNFNQLKYTFSAARMNFPKHTQYWKYCVCLTMTTNTILVMILICLFKYNKKTLWKRIAIELIELIKYIHRENK